MLRRAETLPATAIGHRQWTAGRDSPWSISAARPRTSPTNHRTWRSPTAPCPRAQRRSRHRSTSSAPLHGRPARSRASVSTPRHPRPCCASCFGPGRPPKCWCAARRRCAATPSRPHRRAPRYKSRSPAQPLLVGYACHAHASEPNRGPNRPREHRDDLLRRVATAATQRRRSPSRPRRRPASRFDPSR